MKPEEQKMHCTKSPDLLCALDKARQAKFLPSSRRIQGPERKCSINSCSVIEVSIVYSTEDSMSELKHVASAELDLSVSQEDSSG